MPITFATEMDEVHEQIINVFGPDFNYEILHGHFHDYQGTEGYALFEKYKELVANNVPFPFVIDITSVGFNALNGLPGVLINSFSSKLTSEQLFKLLEAWEDKSACVIYRLSFAEAINSVITFEARLSGVMVNPSNPHTYGWRACFQPDGFMQPYAELPKDIKMNISPCKSAMTELKSHLVMKRLFEV